MAYGLYDQAAELITKALQAEPRQPRPQAQTARGVFRLGQQGVVPRRRKSVAGRDGTGPDADWDKVIIMGKQICPDEPMFAEATASAGAVDIDLEAGEAALDFDLEAKDEPGLDMDLGVFDESSDEEPELQGAPSDASVLEASDEEDVDDDFNCSISASARPRACNPYSTRRARIRAR